MTTTLRLMCVLAHPDDESLGAGGALASCAAQGIETYLVTATRGERGRYGDPAESPGPDVVGRAREAELHAAARELGLREVQFLGYRDGELDQVEPAAAIERIVWHLRRVRPHVVVTFGPDGGYGHPDHIAISQLTVGCRHLRRRSRRRRDTARGASSCRQAVLHRVERREVGRIPGSPPSAGERRGRCRAPGGAVPDWAITTVVDTSHVWPTVWRAVSCHKTQMAIFKGLATLSDDHQRALWGTQEFYRVFSVVNGGRAMESDLFEGLR